jgi:hypothetical protein
MKKDDLLTLIGAVAMIVIPVAIILVIRFYVLAPMSCNSRWPDREPTYSVMGGCQIMVDGKRIPESNYRVL